tara:strand:+ start:779 stop:937 length:159 start_codon:yes stop_codon:yes gene_type:complete
MLVPETSALPLGDTPAIIGRAHYAQKRKPLARFEGKTSREVVIRLKRLVKTA